MASSDPGVRRRSPSPPWFGGLVIGLVWLDALVLLSYTLLDLRWQQSLGSWNYWFAGAIIAVVALLLRGWRADTRV
jgi:hypothetical protein